MVEIKAHRPRVICDRLLCTAKPVNSNTDSDARFSSSCVVCNGFNHAWSCTRLSRISMHATDMPTKHTENQIATSNTDKGLTWTPGISLETLKLSLAIGMLTKSPVGRPKCYRMTTVINGVQKHGLILSYFTGLSNHAIREAILIFTAFVVILDIKNNISIRL